MKKIKVNFKELINFSSSGDIEKANRVKILIEKVINDQMFREHILKSDFKDTRFKEEGKPQREIANNQEVLDIIMAGKEQYSSELTDFEWDFRIALIRNLKNEVGHTFQGEISTKKKLFRKFGDNYIAAHWIHEFMHVIGFKHDHKRTEIRPYSVPYLTGTIAKKLLEKY